MSVSINIACFVIGVILFGIGVAVFTSDSPFFTVFGVFLLLIALSLCWGAFFDVREKMLKIKTHNIPKYKKKRPKM